MHKRKILSLIKSRELRERVLRLTVGPREDQIQSARIDPKVEPGAFPHFVVLLRRIFCGEIILPLQINCNRKLRRGPSIFAGDFVAKLPRPVEFVVRDLARSPGPTQWLTGMRNTA